MSESPSLQVLIIDDNDLASELLSEFVSLLGYRVSVAGTGAQALASCAEQPPHVIIVDIILPDIDGYELATRLRAQMGDGPTILALSGLPKSMQRQASDMFDAWLEKPVDLTVLEKMLADAANRSL